MAKNKKIPVVTTKKETTKPSGAKITRDGGNFTCTWKIPPEKYDKGVKFKYAKKKSKNKVAWKKEFKLKKNAVTQKLKFDYKDYYPYTKKKLDFVSFGVRGLAANTSKIKKVPKKKGSKDKIKKKFVTDYTMSDWTTKTFNVKTPRKPKVAINRVSQYNTKVTITPTYDDSWFEWATQIQYKVGLTLADSKTKKFKNGKNYGKIKKVPITSSKSFFINHTDESTKIVNAPGAKVYVAARVCGPQGASGWVEKVYSYSAPNPATNLRAKMSWDKARHKITVTMDFKYGNSVAHPVSYMKIQYAFAAPNASLQPIDPEWQDAIIGANNTIQPDGKGQNQKAKITFIIDSDFVIDTLLFTRVVTFHNEESNPSAHCLCKTSLDSKKGKIPYNSTRLNSPTIDNVVPPVSGNTYRITFTNNCDASSAYVAIVFHPSKAAMTAGYKDDVILSVVKMRNPIYEQTYTVDVDINPSYNTSKYTYGFGVYAFIGTYKLKAEKPVNYEVLHVPGYKYYTVTSKIRSVERKYGGSIVDPPANFDAEHLGEGNVKLTWAWPSYTIDYAEVAWSDYEQALLSNEPPSTYQIQSNNPNSIIIRNLEMGKTWFFWIRAISNENPSVWSNAADETLSSAPNAPALNVSKDHITIDEKVTLSWAYTSTDGTPQAYANINLCSTDGSVVEYNGPQIASVEDEHQYVVIDPKQFDPPWETGKSYTLAIKVTSQSNEKSDWSNTQTISIMEPIYSKVVSTSLLPMVDVYSSTKLYSENDYVLKMIEYEDFDDDGEAVSNDLESEEYAESYGAPDNKVEGSLYKSTYTMLEPEEWNDDHWAVDSSKQLLELTKLPLTIAVDANTENAVYSLKIERAEDYFVDRPDESEYVGHKGEVIYDSNTPEFEDLYLIVAEPSIDDISIYYEYNAESGQYESAEPLYIIVSNPVDSEISEYYEYEAEYDDYVLTEDEHVVSGKTYYYQTLDPEKDYYILYGRVGLFTIDKDNIYGYFDDTAVYYLIHEIDNVYGQHHETRYKFVVKWDHQATYPKGSATAEAVEFDNGPKYISKIQIDTPEAVYYTVVSEPVVEDLPNYYEYDEDAETYIKTTDVEIDPEKEYYIITGSYTPMDGDGCDIYRISATDITLIYEGANFGETYVDPYPTIGEYGGHRLVYKTVYGDYIVGYDDSIAILDIKSNESDDYFYSDGHIIDFGDESVKVIFNTDVSNNWSKDFQQTKYLGGSIQGDWNLGVSMSSTISTNVLTNDVETMTQMRKLARYEGLCHVRTLDGMNYLADVQVSENIPYKAYVDPEGDTTKLAEYSLTITKVDPVDLDGMTISDWNESITDEEIPPDSSGDIVDPPDEEEEEEVMP